jgi:hypothetical protein
MSTGKKKARNGHEKSINGGNSMSTSCRKIEAMHKEYGVAGGCHLCCECCNYVSGRYHDKVLRKCKAYGLTHSEATDWAKHYEPCGLFNVPFEDKHLKPLIEILKRSKRQQDVAPIDGQMSL